MLRTTPGKLYSLTSVALVIRCRGPLGPFAIGTVQVIELNSSRQAIQVVGCEGQIVTHLPISSDDVQTLEALLE